MVWAAGIKAPDFMKEIWSGKRNRINRLGGGIDAATTRDPDIYAI